MAEEISPRFLTLARRVLPARPVICDIGSRDALEGVALFRQLEAGALHVFEANPDAAEACRRNLAPLGGAAHFNQAAVSDAEGEVAFYPVNQQLSENKDIGFSSLFRINPEYTKRRGSVVQDEVLVRGITLDGYFEDKTGPDLLWIDVEGAELQVFRGAESVLRGVKLIHVEVSFRPMQVGKPLFWEIERYLLDRGFVFRGFGEVSVVKGFLYRRRWLPNLPWRLNAIFCQRRLA